MIEIKSSNNYDYEDQIMENYSNGILAQKCGQPLRLTTDQAIAITEQKELEDYDAHLFFIYEKSWWIAQFENGEYWTVCGNEDLLTDSLEEAEFFLWNGHVKYEHGHRN